MGRKRKEDDGNNLLSRWTHRRTGTTMYSAVGRDRSTCSEVISSLIAVTGCMWMHEKVLGNTACKIKFFGAVAYCH